MQTNNQTDKQNVLPMLTDTVGVGKEESSRTDDILICTNKKHKNKSVVLITD